MLIAACGQKATAPVYYNNPVVRAEAPDPSVIRAADGTFYLYATGGN
jgi:aldose 1-epimerase